MAHMTPAECMQALQELRTLDAESTRRELSAILNAVIDATPHSAAYLEALEALRSPLERVLSALVRQQNADTVARDVATKALQRITETWQKAGQAYACIGQDISIGASAEKHALLAQRRVAYRARAIMDFLRTRRAVPLGLWKALHESFADADARGFAYTRVPDSLNHAWQEQSAAEAHVTMLLVDLSNPFGRSPDELEKVWNWAQHFAPYCSLIADAGESDETRRTAYGVNLASDWGARPITLFEPAPSVRRFDGSQLAEQFRKITSRIKKGGSPGEFGLGEDIASDAATRLLMSLYRPWSRGSSGRRFARRHGGGQIELTGDWRAIGFYIAGKIFEPPKLNVSKKSSDDDIRLLTFGEQVTRIDLGDDEERRAIERTALRRGFVCTQWDILDQSIGGFRLRRQGSTERVEHRKLVAIRPSDSGTFLLGMISWVMYREDGSLEAGIKLLSGLPQVVAIRSVGLSKDRFDPSFQQAFGLSETPALKLPASLVLPAGYFQPFRVIELHDGTMRGYRLLELITRGADFDQVSYEGLSLAS